MQPITYQQRLVGLAGADRAYLVPDLDRRPNDDPTKRFVLLLALYAHQVATGELPDEPMRYLPRRAEQYVREQLMPAPDFLAVADLPDPELADIFGVPLEQIHERRHELDTPPGIRQRLLVQRRGHDAPAQ